MAAKTQPKTAQPVEEMALPHSSFLQAATYDPNQYSLTLDFKSGHSIVHRYIFPLVWQQFKESKSHGSFYSRMIKGKYPSVTMRMPIKVSDLTRAIKEHRHKGKS